MIKAIIVEDDPGIRATNKRLLTDYFSEIELVGETDTIGEAYTLIQEEKPELVLLDIELKDGSGFQLLQKLKPFTFKVVFITAFDNYAIKAIKFNAIDYVMKPVNAVEFEHAVKSAIGLINKEIHGSEQTEILLRQVNQKTQTKKITLRTTEALHLVNTDDILFAKSDNSYTTFHLANMEKILVSKGIVFFEEILAELNFFRPHQSYLVNLQHVKRIDKSDGGFVILDSGHELPVSLRRKKALLAFLDKL